MAMPPLMELEGLVCGHGNRTVVERVSFALEEGELLCLLGPNGVGKTTLFKTLLRLLPSQAGVIRIDGEDTAGWSVRRFAQAVGYVPQAHGVPFPFRVLDVVALGRTAHLGSFDSPSRADLAVAEAALRSAFKALVGTEAPLGGDDSDGTNPMRPLRGLAGVKELVLPLPEGGRARELAGGRSELRVAVASGAGAARALVERITNGDPSLPRFDFVEVMACHGGCAGGAGQPVAMTAAVKARRAQSLRRLDAEVAAFVLNEAPVSRVLH